MWNTSFFTCAQYKVIKAILKRKSETHCAFTLGMLLYGAYNLLIYSQSLTNHERPCRSVYLPNFGAIPIQG